MFPVYIDNRGDPQRSLLIIFSIRYEAMCYDKRDGKSEQPFKKGKLEEVFGFSVCYNGHVTSRYPSHSLELPK